VTWPLTEYHEYSVGLTVLLNQLSDRFVNGVVLYRLAHNQYAGTDNPEKARLYFEASRLIKEKDETYLSADDFFTLGSIAMFDFGNSKTALGYFKRASFLGCEQSTLYLAKLYRKGPNGATRDFTKAFRYQLQAYQMGILKIATHLAVSLESTPSLAPELSFKEFYKIGASLGDDWAIMKCSQHSLTYPVCPERESPPEFMFGPSCAKNTKDPFR
jgi:TPR repeat protein